MAKLLRAVHPNAGVRIAYRKRLDNLIAEMQRSVVWWVRAAYRRDEERIVAEGRSTQIWIVRLEVASCFVLD